MSTTRVKCVVAVAICKLCHCGNEPTVVQNVDSLWIEMTTAAVNILMRFLARLGPHTGDPVQCADVFKKEMVCTKTFQKRTRPPRRPRS